MLRSVGQRGHFAKFDQRTEYSESVAILFEQEWNRQRRATAKSDGCCNRIGLCSRSLGNDVRSSSLFDHFSRLRTTRSRFDLEHAALPAQRGRRPSLDRADWTGRCIFDYVSRTLVFHRISNQHHERNQLRVFGHLFLSERFPLAVHRRPDASQLHLSNRKLDSFFKRFDFVRLAALARSMESSTDEAFERQWSLFDVIHFSTKTINLCLLIRAELDQLVLIN